MQGHGGRTEWHAGRLWAGMPPPKLLFSIGGDKCRTARFCRLHTGAARCGGAPAWPRHRLSPSGSVCHRSNLSHTTLRAYHNHLSKVKTCLLPSVSGEAAWAAGVGRRRRQRAERAGVSRRGKASGRRRASPRQQSATLSCAGGIGALSVYIKGGARGAKRQRRGGSATP